MAVSIISLSNNLNGSNGFRLDGEPESGRLGISVSSAGDINGDGFADVIMGASKANPNNNYHAGSSYVVFGKASGFDATLDLSSLDSSNGFSLDGVAAGDESGGSVSNAGDVNGDGFDDLIIGAPGNRSDGLSTSYVVFGKASGFDAALNLSSLDGSNGFRLDVITEAQSPSLEVSNAGDVNGDGFDDVLVGAGGFTPYVGDSSASYVVFGKASGFDATLDVASLDGSNGFSLNVGDRVSNAGDVNGDGFDDVIIGTYSADPIGDPGGSSSYVVFGKASGFAAAMDLSSLDGSNGFRLDEEYSYSDAYVGVSTAGDVNGDGFDDVIIDVVGAPFGISGYSFVVFGKASGFDATMRLSSLDGSNGFRLNGRGNFYTNYHTGSVVSTAGDVNGDGFDDLIIGNPDFNRGSYYTYYSSGDSYVVFGKASGFDAEMDLSSLDGSNGFRLAGIAGGQSGSSVSSAGDVNGDGFDDLVVGEPFSDLNSDNSGSSYVVFGGNFLNEVVYVGTPGDDSFSGTEVGERFEGGDGNDTLRGQGGADIFHGGAGDDTMLVTDLGFQLADGGIGVDTLEWGGDSINLNLADFRGMIKGTEAIDIGGGNTLTVTALDVLNLSDTSDVLTVNGARGSRVNGLADGWADEGLDGDYHIYTNGEATLRVAAAVSTDWPAPGVISLADLNGNNGFRLDGSEYDSSGLSVSNAGDINGDGFDDVIIDAAGNPFDGSPGFSYVVFGKVSGFNAAMNLSSLDGSNGFRLDGVAAVYDNSGYSVSNAGDVNGDGFGDLIVGADDADPDGIEGAGSSYVVFGKASGFNAAMNLSTLDGSNGFRLDGVEFLGHSGISVSNAGDINGDGFDDLIVGADEAYVNGARTGASYVVFGKASGFDATLNLSSLGGNNGFRLNGVAAGDGLGTSVSNAGDVNGDGFDDVIIGAFLADPNGDYSGASYVVFGKISGFDAAMDLSSLNGNNGFRLDGAAALDYSGWSVSNAGDVNGDGFDDVIIGARGADPNGEDSGSSYVVFGKASGFADTLDLASLDGSNGFSLNGEMVDDSSGFSVSNAGDVNGDGFDDLLVGAPGASPNGSFSGSSYVVFGKASGFDAAMDLSNLNGSNGIRLDGGPGAFDTSGRSVSTAGDVNGDGFDDLIVGAPFADPNGYSSGSSYVIFGRRSFTGNDVIQGTPGDDNLTGTAAAERFEAGDGNDRMIGRGGADLFHGDAGDDYIQVMDLGFASVDGGSGNDVLHTDGKGLNLDLTNFGDKIHGIETICLFGRGDNTLTLTAADLLNLSDTDNTLRVNGNAGDHITVLDDGWVDEGNRGQGYFHVYTNDDAVLLVGMNVTIDLV